jgi:recombination protein RecT
VSTEVATRTVADVILADDFKEKVAQALPPGVTIDRFIRTTLTAIQRNPDVATPKRQQSLFLAVVQCAQDGLLPDGREAAFVTFGDTTAYMPMIGGLRKVAAKYGIAMTAHLVYENDRFEYELGFEPAIVHRPPTTGERGEIIGAYACAIDGLKQRYMEWMSTAEIEKIRGVSRAKNAGPWKDHWGEMARKTVARRLFKQLALADVDDVSARIVAAADADVDFTPDPVTALLDGATLPADDSAPDDTLEVADSVIDEALALPPPADDSPVLATFDQKGRFTQLVKECAKLRGETVEQIKAGLPYLIEDDTTAADADALLKRLATWRDNLKAAA